MDSNFISFPVKNFIVLKQQVLSWANQFSTCCFLDNNEYHFNYQTYECVAGAGVIDYIESSAGNALQQLHLFQQKHNSWLFGHLGYDLKNEIEEVHSSNPDQICFPDLFFFVPQTVLLLNKNELCILTDDETKATDIFSAINKINIEQKAINEKKIVFQPRFSKPDYIDIVEKLRNHILRGDCYEINFCQEFFAEHAEIDPVKIYQLLNDISPSPFAAFYKLTDKYVLCASPERYLKKDGDKIISQPIKGTGKRDTTNNETDILNKENLYKSAKDRSENVMVVDLVRNDLSKICIEASVEVEELFGIYSFPQVHQMISTVRGILQPGISIAEIIQKTFPMGSMTGAPKKKVMELIEKYEDIKRGIFSGAIGYIKPGGDFDFNVIIRSILYNKTTNYLSYFVGSGITFYSSARKEYEECLLKAEAIKKVFA